MSKAFKEFALLSADKTLEKLDSSFDGLTEKEAKKRLLIYGRNELEHQKGWLLRIFFRQFNAFFYLLLFACLIALFLKDFQQLITISLVVVITFFLSFIQEYRSEKTCQRLKSFITSQCLVKRQGVFAKINKKDLVPGDLVVLEEGDVVPADLRILKEEGLFIDESLLTGESKVLAKKVSVLKKSPNNLFDAFNILFAGTRVVSGKAEAMVIAIGKNMELGKITSLIKEKKGKSSFEKNIDALSRFILWLAVGSLLLIFIFNLFLKGPNIDLPRFSLFAIALIVGFVPEALPLVCLITMSKGALQLAKKKAVVKRLSSLEDLGNLEILCVDKTGTLTENKMTLQRIVSKSEADYWQYFLAAVLPLQKKYQTIKSIFDQVLIKQASGYKQVKSELIKELSLDLLKRRDGAIVKINNKEYLIVKGAVEFLLKESTCYIDSGQEKLFDQKAKSFFKQELKKIGQEGKRAYGLAIKLKTKKDLDLNTNFGLCFLGFAVLDDPLKLTVVETIKKAKNLGIDIRVLTGDSQEVAFLVAQKVGLIENKSELVLGEEIERLRGNRLEELILSKKVFARVTPEDKYKIVQILKSQYKVGFLGDGINDVPAMKLADVSLAVDKAADVAKEQADIVLLRKDLRIIIEGIAFGRGIFNNIIKYIKATMSSNFGNCYSLAIISLFVPYLPMLANQILLVNLLSDLPLSAVSLDRVDNEDLLKPVKFSLKEIGFFILFLGIVSSFFDFSFFALFRKMPQGVMQSLWFILSILTEILFVFSARTKHWFFKGSKPSFWLVSISLGVILLAFFIPFSLIGREFLFIAPSLKSALSVAGLAVLFFGVSEIVKTAYYQFLFKKII